MSHRIDVHQHLLPPFYRDRLARHGIDAAGGRPLPDWSAEAALAHMAALQISTAILSVSTPGTSFLDDEAAAVKLAAELNDYCAGNAAAHPEHFGWFATLPMPHVPAAAAQARRVLDETTADGVMLLTNADGRYLGSGGEDELWRVLDERSAIVFIHPASLPAAPVDGVPPFAADFLLDTVRAAYLLVRNQVVRRYPNIRFILSHAGGFVPYSAHRMAVSMAADTGRTILDILEDLRSFYFDTALSSSPAALPTLLTFARPERILFGSDFPFAPTTAGLYFVSGLEDGVHGAQRNAVDHANARALFPRFGGSSVPTPARAVQRWRNAAKRRAASAVFTLVQPR